MKILKSTFVLVVCLSLLTSCISVRKNNVPNIQDNQLKSSSVKKTKIFLDWNYYTKISSNQNQIIIDAVKSSHDKWFSEIVNESGCCEVIYEKDKADIIVSGGFYNESSNTGINFTYLTGLSSGIIPSWINFNMKIEANVKKGNIIKDYVLRDSVFTAFWLPFILAMPFTDNPTQKEDLVQENLYKNLLVEMKNDNLIR